MKQELKRSASTQYVVLLCGVISFLLGARSVWLSYEAKEFVFRFKQLDATGSIAAFELAASILVGLGLISSALWRLRRHNAA